MNYFPILPIMFLIFMTLKLCGVIAWSWWLVTAPLWGGVLFALVVLLVAAFIAFHVNARG
jgi:hypothetical protein